MNSASSLGKPGTSLFPVNFRLQSVKNTVGKPQEQRVVQVGLQVQGDKSSNLQLGEGLAKVQLVTGDGKRMVGVGPDVLSIHMMRPYQDPREPERSGWEEFRPRTETALGAYWDVAQPLARTQGWPSGTSTRLSSLREQSRSRSISNAPLPDVAGLPDQLTNFMSRVDYSYADNVRLVLSQGSIDAPPGHVGFLLDLDVIRESPEPVDKLRALAIANDLRERERAAFEAVITDKARELFDAD